jgi:hypothetical protein
LMACYRLLGFLVLLGSLEAQTGGAILGVVRTIDGTALSTASIRATQVATGMTRQTETNNDGTFMIPDLPAGAYELRVEAGGFQPVLRTGIHLSVSERITVNFSLHLSPLREILTITGSAPLVEAQTSELSYLVAEEAIRWLPLNGRNYTDLALLQPGVNAFPHRDGGSVVAHGLGISMNGQDPRANVYLLDGTPLNDFTNGPAGSAASTALGMETIQEFRVQVNAYSAEFGRSAGGQINALTKSGTNDLHGSLMAFHRNDAMDARNFFDPAVVPEFKRNQFGATASGPLRHDRAFFFAGYEALRERLGRTMNAVIPDENAHRGFLPDPAAPGQLLNVGVHPAVDRYLDEFPLPNGENRGQGLALYTFNFGQKLRQDFGQLRFDRNLANGSQFFVRYTADDAEQLLPTDFPQFPRSFLSRNQFATAQYSYVFSPRVLNVARLGISRTRIGQDVQANTARPLDPFVPGRTLPGNIDIGGASRWGPQSSVNVKLTQNVFSFEDNLSVIRGRHIVKAGALAERYRDNLLNPTFSLGIHTFADLRAFLENRPLRFVGLGPEGQIDRYWRFLLVGTYVQEEYRPHPHLLLSGGIRYEFATMPVDIYGRDSGLVNLHDPLPTPGRLFENSDKTNLSPRLGFAWNIRGTERTSLRGGYGWFFTTNNQQHLIVTVTNPPATPRLIVSSGTTFPVPPFDRAVGNTMRPIEWNIQTANVHYWNLNLQREFPGQTRIMAGYAGSRGIHLWRNTDANIPIPQVLSDGTQYWASGLSRPNPNFGTLELKKSDGNSWYNALIVEVRRQWRRGLSLQFSHTWSRNIDTTQASTFFSDATNGNISAMPEFFGLQYNKGLADFHAKHVSVLNFIWDLPVKQRGWRLAGIVSGRSGNPLTLFVSQNRSRSQWNPSVGPGIGLDRPNMASGYSHRTAVRHDPAQWFDPRAFTLQSAGTLGNLGRGALIGPNLRSMDLSLMRDFTVSTGSDPATVQFRIEAFNLLNRPNFGIPGLTAFAGARDGEAPFTSLGLIRSTVTSSRQIQVGLRLSF